MRGRDPVQGKEGSFQSALGMIARFDAVRLDSTAKGLGQSMVAAAALFASVWRKYRDVEVLGASRREAEEKRQRVRT
jgi:hypothetical protein